jgi:hypothetical protein
LVVTFYVASVILSNYQTLPATEFSLIIAKYFTEKNKYDSLKYLGKNSSKTVVILVPRILFLPVNIHKIIKGTGEQLKYSGIWKSSSFKKQKTKFLKQTVAYQ